MIRIVLALAALAVLMSAAHAASFDCAKAATSMERAICSSPDLSAQDEVLAQAYATALGGLSKPAAAEIKSAQHSWIGYAERICSDDGEPIAGEYTDDQTACLNSTYVNRVRDLESSRMQGGFRFYPIDRYLVEPDTEAQEGDFVKVADKHVHAVRIDRNDDVAAAFNTMVEDMLASYRGSGEGDRPLLDESSDLVPGDVTTDVEISVTVKDVTTRRITLAINDYSYGHGAAHGNYTVSYAHFLIDQKRPLEAGDMFAGEGWQDTLGQLVLEKLKASIDGGVWEESEADIPAWATEPSRWDFDAQGLVVQFQPYEVTAYAAGAPTALIPWSELGAIMTPDAEAIATW